MVPAKGTFRRQLVGRSIVAVDRIAKRLVLRLDNRRAVVFEPRMTGLVLLADPPDEQHLRLGLKLSHQEHSRLWFWDRRGLGSVKIWSESQLGDELGPDHVGPDALEVTLPELCDRLAGSRRIIKVALLDQTAIAGIGNLYASEILHMAKLHPELPCYRLTQSDWRRVHAALREVLRRAIAYEGSTLSDGTYRNALNQAGSYQKEHRVYGRADQPCVRCGATIVRAVHGQRSTFFCPICQRKRRFDDRQPT
jgi:formamidopyrimidine-DNA glycosylase